MRGMFSATTPRPAVGKQEREEVAAQRIYGLLPGDQGRELRELWEEFEERETPEARFAACLDRLQPFLLNFFTQGGTWRIHNVPAGQVRKRLATVGETSPALGEVVEHFMEKAIELGSSKRMTRNKKAA